jgi:hypothetical protein
VQVFGIVSSGQVYYVREMIAALIMFSVFSGLVAGVALIIFMLGHAGHGTLAWAEKKCGLEMRVPAEDPGKNRFDGEIMPAGLEFVEAVKILTPRKAVSTGEQSVFHMGGDA